MIRFTSASAILAASTLLLAGCGSADKQADPSAEQGSSVSAPSSDSTRPPPAQSSDAASAKGSTDSNQLVSCAADIGAETAQERVDICKSVSPATHPPCNAANSCALIEDEIARSCALFADGSEPMEGCDINPKGMQAAADVVRRYYSAINAHDYSTAWSQWGENGKPGQSFEDFRKGFAQTRSAEVQIGKLTRGGAGAGSIYQTVPVTVTSVLNDGTRQHFSGNYTVRRVNDIDGASAAQLRWHLGSAQLHSES